MRDSFFARKLFSQSNTSHCLGWCLFPVRIQRMRLTAKNRTCDKSCGGKAGSAAAETKDETILSGTRICSAIKGNVRRQHRFLNPRFLRPGHQPPAANTANLSNQAQTQTLHCPSPGSGSYCLRKAGRSSQTKFPIRRFYCTVKSAEKFEIRTRLECKTLLKNHPTPWNRHTAGPQRYEPKRDPSSSKSCTAGKRGWPRGNPAELIPNHRPQRRDRQFLFPPPILPLTVCLMQERIEDFILYLDTERGLSVNYQLSTRRSLESFLSWIGRKNVGKLQEIQPALLSEYLSHRKALGLASASVKLESVALRVFFRFLVSRNCIENDPSIFLGTPRIERYLPDTLRIEQIEKILLEISDRDPCGMRDRALFELLYASGLRASEACRLRIEELDIKEHVARITGKGTKTRLVPVGSKALKALQKYLDHGRPELVTPKTGSHIFLSIRGKALTPQRIWQLAKKYTLAAGLEENVYPHLFRHSFATHLLSNGADLRIIQELLGHADIATTQIYTHVDQNRLRSVHHKFHPRSKMKPHSSTPSRENKTGGR